MINRCSREERTVINVRGTIRVLGENYRISNVRNVRAIETVLENVFLTDNYVTISPIERVVTAQ